MSDELITYVIGQLRGACWEEEAAAVEALVKERDDLRNFDDYFRSVCGFKRDGRDSSKCLDDFLAGINRQDIHIPFDHFLQVQKERGELKAHIEELEMELDRQAVRLRAACAVVVKRVTQERDEAEAKLAKAVEALRKCLDYFEQIENDFGPLHCGDTVRAVLAELEGNG